MPAAETDSWTKWGVIIAAAALVIGYLSLAAAVKWPPFSPSNSGGGGAASTPSPPALVATTPPADSIGASFLKVDPGLNNNSTGINPYYVQIYITGLQGASVTIRWKTLNGLGLPAGTSGERTTGTLEYSGDTWSGTFDVTLPAAAYDHANWSTEFTAYAPNGVVIADVD